jgi:hypothetical protein
MVILNYVDPNKQQKVADDESCRKSGCQVCRESRQEYFQVCCLRKTRKGRRTCFRELLSISELTLLKFQLVTEGVNFQQVWEHKDQLDMNKIDCNDIYSILKTYGIKNINC